MNSFDYEGIFVHPKDNLVRNMLAWIIHNNYVYQFASCYWLCQYKMCWPYVYIISLDALKE